MVATAGRFSRRLPLRGCSKRKQKPHGNRLFRHPGCITEVTFTPHRPSSTIQAWFGQFWGRAAERPELRFRALLFAMACETHP